jgi:hypothetical protein
MRTAWRLPLALVLTLVAVVLGVEPARGNGGEGKVVVYRGTLPAGDGAGPEAQFDAEVQPMFFRLATVRNAYRVVRIRIRNVGARSLVLSAGGDAVQVQLRSGATVTGVLDLGARDAAVWDALPADLRGLIAYPQRVEGGEEESVFVFLPLADSADVPRVFRYTLRSRPDRPVVIRDVSAAVAH